MITFGTACSADREALLALWLEAFPEDTPEDAESFLCTWFTEKTALVARENETVVSMLFLLGQPLCIGDTVLTAGYIYAGATSRTHRGRGLYRRLLAFAARYAVQNGMDALFLHPADASLADSYRRMGFTVPMTCGVCERVSDAREWNQLTAADYRTLRKRALSDTAYIDWDDTALSYALTWCRAVQAGEDTALLGERDGQAFAWECFGSLPPSATGGRTRGEGETVGLMQWLGTSACACPSTVYMGYGFE